MNSAALQLTAGNSKRIPQLDGLRGVAILMVLVFHYVGWTVNGGEAPYWISVVLWPTLLGWSGVDLFFVLSGFLIGGILLDARKSSNYFQAFYVRRVCRILPLYFAFLVTAGAAATITRFPFVLPWKACVVFLQNIWMAANDNTGGMIAGHTWSLAVEEQFYLTLPALIYFARPGRLPKVLIGGIILAPLIRLAIFLSGTRSSEALYVLLPCRMDSLLVGVLVAWFVREPGTLDLLRSSRRRIWLAIEIVSVICVACCTWLIPGTAFAARNVRAMLSYLVGFDALALLFALLLLAALFDEDLYRPLQAKWLMGLGSIAYGVYLIHPVAFRIVAFLLPHRWLTDVLIAAIGTVALAKASWEWFERRLVKIGHRVTYGEANATAEGEMKKESSNRNVVPVIVVR